MPNPFRRKSISPNPSDSNYNQNFANLDNKFAKTSAQPQHLTESQKELFQNRRPIQPSFSRNPGYNSDPDNVSGLAGGDNSAPIDNFDQMASTDNSQAQDFSSGTNPNQDLLNQEQNATNAAGFSNQKSGFENQNDVTKAEHGVKVYNSDGSLKGTFTKRATNPKGQHAGHDYTSASGKKSGIYLSSGKGGKFKSKPGALKRAQQIRRGLAAGGAVISLIAAGIGIGSAGPSLLLNKVADVMEKKFNVAALEADKKIEGTIKCKLDSSCPNANKGVLKNIKHVSQSLKDAFAKNGSSITEGGSITTKEGKTITAGNVENLAGSDPLAKAGLNNSSPGLRATVTTFFGKIFRSISSLFNLEKRTTKANNVGDNADGENLMPERVVGQDDLDPTKEASNTKAPPVEDRVTQQVKTTVDGGSGSGVGNIKSNARDAEEPGAPKELPNEGHVNFFKRTYNGAKSAASKMLGKLQSGTSQAVQMVLSLACDLKSALNGASALYRMYKMTALIRYAQEFLSVADQIRSADGSSGALPGTAHGGPTPEQVTQTAGQLTAVFKDNSGNPTTKSFSDSALYHYAAGFTTSFTPTKTGYSPGQPSPRTADYVQNGQLGGIAEYFQNALNSVLGKTSFAGNSICGPVLSMAGTLGMISTSLGGAVASGLSIAVSTIGSWFGNTGNVAAGWLNTAINVGASCGQIIITGGAAAGQPGAISGCLMALVGAAVQGVMAALQGGINSMVTNLVDNYLYNPAPLGEAAMDAIGSGSAALMGTTANGVGNAPLTKSQAVENDKRQRKFQVKDAMVDRMTKSPFDIYDNNTFVGSIAGNFIASLYSNGDSPLGMAQSLLGMFGSSFANFGSLLVSGDTAYADAMTTEALNQCGDDQLNSSGAAFDPMCNPVYGLPAEYDMPAKDVINQMNALDTQLQALPSDPNTLMPNGDHPGQPKQSNKWRICGGQSIFDDSDTVYGLNRNACESTFSRNNICIDDLGHQAAIAGFTGDDNRGQPNDGCDGRADDPDDPGESNRSDIPKSDWDAKMTTVGDFIDTCITRSGNEMGNSQYESMGNEVPVSLTGSNDPDPDQTNPSKLYNGNACVLGTPEQQAIFPDAPLLYNYIMYTQTENGLNEGSSHGAQADGN